MAFTDRFRVKLRILDEDYVMLSPASPAHLERLGKLVDQKMREMIAKEPRLSVTRAAVMTAMMFADQALNQEERVRQMEQELSELRAENIRLAESARSSSGGANHNNRKGRR